jgi:FSR family fosmidomycin resistance protein-like MFS transporter
MLRKDKLTLVTLCAGHFVSDSYSSVIYPLLPLLAAKLRLTSSQVFLLAPLYAISSSLMQPVYGVIADRYAKRLFVVFGPVITAVFVSLIGLAPSYAVLMALLMAAGIGIGSFHPQGAAMAAAASGDRRRIGMAMFSAFGTLGFAVGPFMITRLVSAVGLEHSYYIVFMGAVISALLFRYCPPLISPVSGSVARPMSAPRLRTALGAVWKPLVLLYAIMVIRSGLQVTTNNYMPFLLSEQGYGLTYTGNVLTVFLLAGGLGGLAGGFVAEKFSGRSVTLYSGLLAGPLMIAAFSTTGPLSTVLLGAGGFVLLSTIPVIIAMAQELVPGQTSTVSALMMGAAWGIGALSPALLDSFVPAFGFRRVLVFASAFTLVAGGLAYFLPREEGARQPLIESDLATATAGD